QKQYLQGFTTGMLNRGVSLAPEGPGGGTATPAAAPGSDISTSSPAAAVYGTPVDDLAKEERIKLERDSLAIWDTIAANATDGKFPEGGDVFRYKFHGLFYVNPAQDAFMIRLRMP